MSSKEMIERYERRNRVGRFENVVVHRVYDEEFSCYIEKVECPTADLSVIISPLNRDRERGDVYVSDEHFERSITIPTEIAIEVAFAIIRQTKISDEMFSEFDEIEGEVCDESIEKILRKGD